MKELVRRRSLRKLHVISKDDLIRNKLASGRETDALDVKLLRRDR